MKFPVFLFNFFPVFPQLSSSSHCEISLSGVFFDHLKANGVDFSSFRSAIRQLVLLFCTRPLISTNFSWRISSVTGVGDVQLCHFLFISPLWLVIAVSTRESRPSWVRNRSTNRRNREIDLALFCNCVNGFYAFVTLPHDGRSSFLYL